MKDHYSPAGAHAPAEARRRVTGHASEPMTQDAQRLARAHNRRRAATVFDVLAMVDVMTVSGILSGRVETGFSGAAHQIGRGRNQWSIDGRLSRNDNAGRWKTLDAFGHTAAAHPIPCTIGAITGDGRVSSLVNLLPAGAERNFLDRAMSATTVVPKIVNQADSLAESHGLAAAFARAVERQRSISYTFKGARTTLDQAAIKETYQSFLREARQSFQAARVRSDFDAAAWERYAASDQTRIKGGRVISDDEAMEDADLCAARSRVLATYADHTSELGNPGTFLDVAERRVIERLETHGLS